MSHDGKSIVPEESPIGEYRDWEDQEPEEVFCTRCSNELFVEEPYYVGNPEDHKGENGWVGEMDVDMRIVPCPDCNENDWQNKKPCPTCHGQNQCKTCNGEGRVHKNKKEVRGFWRKWLSKRDQI